MRPIPQTVEVARAVSREHEHFDVLAHLDHVADQVRAQVPDCVGLSITWIDRGLTFTLVATADEIAELDAVQTLAGGPCLEGIDHETGMHWSNADPLDERRWQEFAKATAARGIQSTLTLPLVADGAVVGSANLYAVGTDSFAGHVDEIARIVGGDASDVVANADLEFGTRRAAEASPAALEAAGTVRATGAADELTAAVDLLAGLLDVEKDQARSRLMDAAERTRISPQHLARTLLQLFS